MRLAVEPEALTPKEFGAKFKRSQSWAYRQINEGKVKTLDMGRIMIPSTEVERLFATAKAKATSAKLEESVPRDEPGKRAPHRLPVPNQGAKLLSDAYRRAGQK